MQGILSAPAERIDFSSEQNDPFVNMAQQEEADATNNSMVYKTLRERNLDPHILNAMDVPVPTDDDDVSEEQLGVLGKIEPENNEVTPGYQFNKLAEVVYNYYNRQGNYQNVERTAVDQALEAVQGFGQFVGLQPRSQIDRLSDKGQLSGLDLTRFGVEWAAQLLYSDIGMARGVLEAENIPEEVAIAQAGLMHGYNDHLKDFTKPGTTRFIQHLMANPSTMFGVGSLGAVRQLLGQGGARAVREGMLKRLMKSAFGHSIIGTETSAYTAAADYAQQVLEHGGDLSTFQYNKNQGIIAAAAGFSLGVTGSAVLPPLAKSIFSSGKNLVRQIEEGKGTLGLTTEDVTPEGMKTVFQSPVAKERSALRGRTLEDLEENIPSQLRTVKPLSPGPKTTVDGKPFLTLDLETPGRGANFDQKQLDQMWNDALDETGPVARDVLAELTADGKTMAPRELAFWDKGLRLPDRSRYWYEISAEDFRARFPDLSDYELSRMIDVVAATSPQADPHQNIRRAVGAISQDLRKQPIDVDIVSPTSVQQALSEAKLEGLKTGSFSGTFQYHLGLEDVPPLSTNDRQVASSFGISGDDISGNDVVYEVLSRFYMKMRDQLNEGLPPGAEPYETWQLQALGWVQERMGKGNPKNDDYVQALDQLVVDMNKAGIELPDGKFTREVLLDPRLEKVVSGTVDRFRSSPIATVETVTTQTDAGIQTAAIAAQAAKEGNTAAVKAHQQLVQRSLKRLITRRPELGKKSVVDVVVRAATGKNPGLTRMEVGQGTYQGTLSQNARIPLPSDMTPTQIRGVLAVLGRGLKQDAVPASLFKYIEVGDDVAEGSIETHSIFIRDVDNTVTDDQILALQKALPTGHDVNVKKVANGMVIDVNPKFADDGSVSGVTYEEAVDAIHDVGLANLQTVVSPKHYNSEYVETSGYNSAISNLRREILDGMAAKLAKEFKGNEREARRALKGTEDLSGYSAGRQERIRKARDRYLRRISDFSKGDKEARKISSGLEADNKVYNKRFGELLTEAEGTGKKQPKPEAENIGLLGKKKQELIPLLEKTRRQNPKLIVKDLIKQGLWKASDREEAVKFLETRRAVQEQRRESKMLIDKKSQEADSWEEQMRLSRRRPGDVKDNKYRINMYRAKKLGKNVRGRELWNKTNTEIVDSNNDLDLKKMAIRTANLEAVPRQLKKQGWKKRHSSINQAQRRSSHYLVSPDGNFEVRLSDHDLPPTPERINRGTLPRWDEEIVLTGKEGPSDVIDEILDMYKQFIDEAD